MVPRQPYDIRIMALGLAWSAATRRNWPASVRRSPRRRSGRARGGRDFKLHKLQRWQPGSAVGRSRQTVRPTIPPAVLQNVDCRGSTQ